MRVFVLFGFDASGEIRSTERLEMTGLGDIRILAMERSKRFGFVEVWEGPVRVFRHPCSPQSEGG